MKCFLRCRRLQGQKDHHRVGRLATQVTGITCEAFQWDIVEENFFIHLKFLLLKNLKKGLSRQGTTLNDYMEAVKSYGDVKG